MGASCGQMVATSYSSGGYGSLEEFFVSRAQATVHYVFWGAVSGAIVGVVCEAWWYGRLGGIECVVIVAIIVLLWFLCVGNVVSSITIAGRRGV